MPHLSYIGDADIGEGTNLGASTITANYDGYRKHRTTIGSRVKTSVDTTLVAPVTVGDDAYTGAGSVITTGRARGRAGRRPRARRRNIDGYAERRRRARRGRTPRTGADEPRPSRQPPAVHSATKWASSRPRARADGHAARERQAADARLRPRQPGAGARIADKLGVELSGANLKTFANGEVYCRYEESVRGADVFIVQPTCGNAADGA